MSHCPTACRCDVTNDKWHRARAAHPLGATCPLGYFPLAHFGSLSQAQLVYRQIGEEALARARALRSRAAACGATLDGVAYSAMLRAHAVLGRDTDAAQLLDEVLARKIALEADGYEAALSSAREPRTLRAVTDAMTAAPAFSWLGPYADPAAGALLAVGGAFGARRIFGPANRKALAATSAVERRAALGALNLLSQSVGSVTALLQDLAASGLGVDTQTRTMLLGSAMLEGRVQQQVALSVWLPLLSPHGDALLEALGDSSLRLVHTPSSSGFKGGWCFEWGGPDVHPALRAWMQHRAATDKRASSGLCPVDVGVMVLEGLLIASAKQPPMGGPQGQQSQQQLQGLAQGSTAQGAQPAARQLMALWHALRALVVRREAAIAARSARDQRGFAPPGADTAAAAGKEPALGSFSGPIAELLVALDLQKGLRSVPQLQSAKVDIPARGMHRLDVPHDHFACDVTSARGAHFPPPPTHRRCSSPPSRSYSTSTLAPPTVRYSRRSTARCRATRASPNANAPGARVCAWHKPGFLADGL